MIPAGIPADEAERLKALESYHILDTAPEESFDAITRMAAHILDMPVARISFVAGDRQWFKSRYGSEAVETPRDISFCGHVVAQGSPLVVEDARKDERFRDNPLVTGPEQTVFYAGFPLHTMDGHNLGSLCVVDSKPRGLSQKESELLSLLADQVVAQLELKKRLANEARLTAELAEREAELSLMLDVLPGLYVKVSGEGRIEGIHGADSREVFPDDDPSGKTLEEAFPAEAAGLLRAAILRARESWEAARAEIVLKVKGEPRHFEAMASATSSSRAVCMVWDVTRRVEAETALQESQRQLLEKIRIIREMADKDPLSGLLLRRAFEEAFNRAFSSCRREGRPLSVALVDLDKFKNVNDEHGHAAGDQVIARFGKLVRKACRTEDLACRWGGEEFLLVFPGQDPQTSARVLERLLREFGELPFQMEGQAPFRETFTAGVAGFPSEGSDLETLTKRADERLYAGKAAGRARIVSGP